ncbi:hypothetical protein [Ottowia thiooxydans]|uniref:hypothetical protein n=1 Tax=Ottowia thiooxydans TaxID=219182 RepID=UPI000401B899|nr:hypothetical protein [Ottowia thiooxydans]
MVYSFDVFDTCVSRMHAYPRDLFFDLGLRLAPGTSDEAARQRFARRFQSARIRAEKLANWRARPDREHADIFAIYENLRHLIRIDGTTLELVTAELTAEEESLYPVSETVEHIIELRQAGHQILFVSDMYIPALLLEPILKRKNVMQEGDRLYVSSDSGVTKHSGKLFAQVLGQEALSGADLLHAGDNHHADIRSAAAHGILTRYFSAAHLTAHEARLAGAALPRDSAASWIASFSRRCRLSIRQSHGEARHPLDGIIFSVIVPFLLTYVQWVLDDARQRGIARLYFAARDGEILFKIAKELNPEGIELRYLYGSRRAWFGPSMTQDHPEWRRPLVLPGNANTPRDILERIGLPPSEYGKLHKIFAKDEAWWERSLGSDEANAFVEELTNHPESAELLNSSALEKRELALRYFRQEGLLDGSTWAFVDSGWSLNNQASAKRMLDQINDPHQSPQGYYLGLTHDHLEEAQAGKAFAFVTPPGSIFSRRRVVIEHCFLPATHASTCAYRLEGTKVIPEFSEEARDDTELAYAKYLQEGAQQAARMIAHSPELRKSLIAFTPEIRAVVENFICHPNRMDALAMSTFTVIADMRQERSFAQPLCRPLKLEDVWTTMLMALSKRKMFKSDAWMWLEGSAALSPRIVQLPIRSMLWLDGLKNRLKIRS